MKKKKETGLMPFLIALTMVLATHILGAQNTPPAGNTPADARHPAGTYDAEHPQKPFDPQHPDQNQQKEGTYNNNGNNNGYKQKETPLSPEQKSPNAYPDGSNNQTRPKPKVSADDKTPKSGKTQHRNVQKPKSNQPVQPVPPGNK